MQKGFAVAVQSKVIEMFFYSPCAAFACFTHAWYYWQPGCGTVFNHILHIPVPLYEHLYQTCFFLVHKHVVYNHLNEEFLLNFIPILNLLITESIYMRTKYDCLGMCYHFPFQAIMNIHVGLTYETNFLIMGA